MECTYRCGYISGIRVIGYAALMLLGVFAIL